MSKENWANFSLANIPVGGATKVRVNIVAETHKFSLTSRTPLVPMTSFRETSWIMKP